jgi:cytochrome c oxidase subunit II
MEKIFLFIILVLVAIITFLVYRIVYFLFIKKTLRVITNKTGSVNACIFPVFFVVGMSLLTWYSLINPNKFFRDASSIHGEWIDETFWTTLVITGLVFLATQFMLFYFPFHYRMKEAKPAVYYPNNFRLEFFWTLIPLVTFIGLFIYSFTTWNKITADPPIDAVQIEIMGEQFNWRVRYPGRDNKFGAYHFGLISKRNDFGIDLKDPSSLDDFAPVQLHIPKGKPVLFILRSRDVVHSVYIPHFRLKMDAVPGMPTRFHFIPKYSTEEMRDKLEDPNFNYELACAELCGRAHYAMLSIVVVDEQEEFEKWYKEQEPMVKKMALTNDLNQ